MSSDSSSPDPGDNGATKNGDGGGGGGGGGGASPSNYPGAGGGGSSGQDNSHGGSPGNGGASGFDTRYVNFNYDGFGNDGDGYVNIKFTGLTDTDTTVTRNTTVSGTKTPTLTIQSDTVGIQTVQCVVSSEVATNVSVASSVGNFVTASTANQSNLNVEAIGIRNTATLSSINLSNGDFTLETTSTDPDNEAYANLYCIYSPDKDLNVEMDLYGGKGKGFDESGGTGEDFPQFNGYEGGEGGYSRIRFTMEKNVEYVIAGLIEAINAPFVYRKGSLIACVGEGGDGGRFGRGGAGGGVFTSGEDGQGRLSGLGGVRVASGDLPGNGIFGGSFEADPLLPGDVQASGTNSGRTIKCTKGEYWAEQGITACSDVTAGSKFRLPDGTEVTNTSSSITRGYKSGYNIIQTAGSRGGSDGGKGGNGATGGEAGVSGGGGGGSGYFDGVTMIDNQLGGSNFTKAKIVLRVVTS